jgi:glucose/arabinose dehydrogenase
VSRRLAALAFAFLCLGAVAASPGVAGAEGVLPSGFRDTVAIAELTDPTAVRFTPDGQVFVAQKDGEILLFDSIDDTTPKVFADLREQVYEYGDRGLLGLELDPKFEAGRPYVYALYTFDHLPGVGGDAPGAYPHWHDKSCIAESGGEVDACAVNGRLIRLTDENEKGVGEKLLVEGWCQQFSSHSIGALGFGPEGALFASGGEGASFVSSDYGQFGWPHKNQCGDPPGGEGLTPPSAEGGSLRSQDLLTPSDPLNPTADPTGLSGTLIRIDPDTGAGWPGNPMAASQDPDERRIVAFGFRNPFRFAIDPRSSEVYVDNVGNGTDEEIDRVPIGAGSAYNSGWPCFEGAERNPGFESLGLGLCEGLYDQPGSTAEPFYYYSHASGVSPDDPCPTYNGSAITGSTFYEAGAFPGEYDNALFFADSVRGCIYVMEADDDGDLNPLTTHTFLGEGGPYTGADLQVGPDGALYYLSLYGDEGLHRISYAPHAPVARLTADRYSGPASAQQPLAVHLDAGASTDPDGEALKYEWDLDEDGTYEVKDGGPTQTAHFTAVENAKVYVRVKDQSGESSIAVARIYAGDTPPQVKISKPLESLTWEVGQPIQFEGSAKAKEGSGAAIPTAQLYWRTSLLHCPGGVGACHAHPLGVFPAVDAGELTGPDHDYPSKIKLSLTATDSRGLSATKTIELSPKTALLQIASNPPGIPLTASNVSAPAPFPLTAIEGDNVTLAAPQTAAVGGVAYDFVSWSDGGARVHSLVATESKTYTAIYAGPSGEPEPEPEPEQKAPVTPGPSVTSTPPSDPAPLPLGPRASPASPTIGGHPGKRTAATVARFEFGSTTAGAGFACRLDGARAASCRSPRVYRKLKPGRHVFRVFAEATGDGSLPSTAVVFRWRVVEGKP